MPRPRRLSDLEADQAREQRRAAAWARAHPEMPDLDARQGFDGQVMQTGERRERLRRFAPTDGVDVQLDAPIYHEGGKMVPLISKPQSVNLKGAELGARVEHVLTFLTQKQQDTLMQHYVEGLSLAEMRTGRESRQAVHERVAWARLAFLKAWRDHAEDEIIVKEVDF